MCVSESEREEGAHQLSYCRRERVRVCVCVRERERKSEKGREEERKRERKGESETVISLTSRDGIRAHAVARGI